MLNTLAHRPLPVLGVAVPDPAVDRASVAIWALTSGMMAATMAAFSVGFVGR